MPNRSPVHHVTTAARFIGGVFGFVFFGIGLSVIIFLWSAPFGDFHSPPLFFRVFGSLIALAFVGFGGTMLVSAIVAGGLLAAGFTPAAADEAPSPAAPDALPPPRVGYTCPSCGGVLGEKADVSPLGDVKCPFCGRWFNIHGKR